MWWPSTGGAGEGMGSRLFFIHRDIPVSGQFFDKRCNEFFGQTPALIDKMPQGVLCHVAGTLDATYGKAGPFLQPVAQMVLSVIHNKEF